MTTSKVVNVTNGPSIYNLCDALRLRSKVMFALEDATPLTTFVNGINVHKDDDDEDSVGNLWILKLYDPHKILGAHELHAYYNTKTRRGHVQPSEDLLAA